MDEYTMELDGLNDDEHFGSRYVVDFNLYDFPNLLSICSPTPDDPTFRIVGTDAENKHRVNFVISEKSARNLVFRLGRELDRHYNIPDKE